MAGEQLGPGPTRTGTIICEAIVADSSRFLPDVTLVTDDVLYLVSPKVGGQNNFPSKINDMQQGISYGLKDGRRNFTVNLGKAFVKKFGDTYNNNTKAFNKVKTWLCQHNMQSELPLYIFQKNFTDDEWLDLSLNLDGTPSRFMKGFVRGFGWELGAANVYYLKSITFKECLQ